MSITIAVGKMCNQSKQCAESPIASNVCEIANDGLSTTVEWKVPACPCGELLNSSHVSRQPKLPHQNTGNVSRCSFLLLQMPRCQSTGTNFGEVLATKSNRVGPSVFFVVLYYFAASVLAGQQC